jgi:hypothetical protein
VCLYASAYQQLILNTVLYCTSGRWYCKALYAVQQTVDKYLRATYEYGNHVHILCAYNKQLQ